MNEVLRAFYADLRKLLRRQQTVGGAISGRYGQLRALAHEGVALGLAEVVADEAVRGIDGHRHINIIGSELGGHHIGELGALAMMVTEQRHAVGQVETPGNGDGVVAHVLLVVGRGRHHFHVGSQLFRCHHVVLQQVVHQIDLAIAARPALYGIAESLHLDVVVVVVVLGDVHHAVFVGIAHQRRALEGQLLALYVAGLHLGVPVDGNGNAVGCSLLPNAVHIPLYVVADTHRSRQGQLSFIFHHIVQIQQSVSVIHRHVRPPRGLVYLYDIDIAVAHGGTDEGDEFRARQVYFEGGEFYAHRWPERSDKHGVGVLVLDGGSIVQTLQGARLIGRRLRRMGTNRHTFEHRRLQVATLCFP